MKTFKQYITEKPAKLSATFPYKGADWDDFRGLENPTEREIRALMKKSKFKELRFLVDKKGKMWAWDTEDALHEPVVFAMTGQKYVGDYAKGMISFINPDDEDDYMAVPDGNLHVLVLNTRTVGDNFALKNKTMKALAKRVNAKGKDRVWWKGV
tara:strand:- start:242 stop:703 length:462 start_codon:yes stop_codon:yes gene_type:complete